MMFDNTDSWHPPAQGVRPTLMPSCQSRMFIQIWTQPRPEKVSTPAAAFLPGLVSIMNTFWFYGIIQIHYDACQIIARVHVKKLVKITIKANNAFNAQQKKFIEYGENIKINFARPGGRENECCSYVMFVLRRRQQRGPDEDVLRVPGHQARPALSRRGGHQGGDENIITAKNICFIIKIFVTQVMRANYGRFSVAICNEHGITDWSVNCMAPRSLRIMQDRWVGSFCNGN